MRPRGDSTAINSALAPATEYTTECMENSTAYSSGGGLGRYAAACGDVPICIVGQIVDRHTETHDVSTRVEHPTRDTHDPRQLNSATLDLDNETLPFQLILKNV